jgi:hypothetical protein
VCRLDPKEEIVYWQASASAWPRNPSYTGEFPPSGSREGRSPHKTGIVVGTVAGIVILFAVIALLLIRRLVMTLPVRSDLVDLDTEDVPQRVAIGSDGPPGPGVQGFLIPELPAPQPHLQSKGTSTSLPARSPMGLGGASISTHPELHKL